MNLKYSIFILLFFIFGFNQILSQEKNKSKIENYLLKNYSFSSEKYTVKGSIETNPNYDVYYIQQKLTVRLRDCVGT